MSSLEKAELFISVTILKDFQSVIPTPNFQVPDTTNKKNRKRRHWQLQSIKKKEA